MPRFLRRNLAIRGLASTDTRSTRDGIYTPASAGADQLIVPQVIPWPFTTDDDGVSFPAGTVGIRSVAQARTTERAWATAGDPLEDLDQWVPVPDTLPGSYTARDSRDHDRGHRTTGFSAKTRGTPYLTIAKNGAGEHATFSGNYTLTANGYESLASWVVNGQTPGTLTGNCPTYRPSGGGGLVPLDWVPMGLSKQTLRCYMYDAAVPPFADMDPSIAGYFYTEGGVWVWTKPDIGARAITMVALVATTAFLWAATGNTDVAIQFIVKSNTDGSVSGNGANVDYLSPIYRKSDLVYIATVTGVDYYYLRVSIPVTWNRTKAQGIGAYKVGWAARANQVLGSHSWSIIANAAGSGMPVDYQQGYRLSPRADVPAWFSTYGQGIGAPGGV